MQYSGRVRVLVIAASMAAIVGLFLLLNVAKKKPAMKSVNGSGKKAIKVDDIKSKVHKQAALRTKIDTKHATHAPSAAEMKSFNLVADKVADGKFLDELLELTPQAACQVFIYEFDVKGVLIVTKHVDDDGDHHLPKFQGAPKVNQEKAVKMEKITPKSQDDHAALLHHHHDHHFRDDKHISLFCKSFQAPEVGRTIRVVKSVKYPHDKYIIEMIR